MGTHDLEPRQRLTLEVGSVVVLAALGLGLQLGRWSAWTVLIAFGGYLIWVIAYSETTVVVSRRAIGGVHAKAGRSSKPATPPEAE